MTTALRCSRGLAAAVAALAALAGLIYLAAWLSLDSSGIARSIIWMDADTDDYRRFPLRTVASGEAHFTFAKAPGYPDGLPANTARGHDDLASTLEESGTTAFIVIMNDRLVYERYFNGHGQDSVQTSFSVAKSFNSALIGAAIADRLIESVEDPVTKYIPELLDRDERFRAITIRHLLSMSSGLRYEETGTPWGDDTQTYYNPDLRRLAVEETEIVEAPGRRFHYNNFNPILIGMILERATGMSVSDYLSRKIWQPIGAEVAATWSLDSEATGFEKMESGINARAIDFAKLGSLYLHGGRRQGKQVLPAAWVTESTRRSDQTDTSIAYQYGWWTFNDEVLGDYFAAIGNKGQYIFVFPSGRLVIVRHGTGRGNIEWLRFIPDIARQLRVDEMGLLKSLNMQNPFP
ncbi:serine hydrolase [Nitratireductor sp. ZSWI3]|uniref:serine hydrolase domain-containing protein n=1 Tax=Nitratireductor sp. ZSWI3 TaxID=2966359 RepID=UPI00215020ED|nr:serine hydrolase [Nitratireductor sp. ZSWI3]MCR4266637.1 beta-lactamase family protein [Nitratireductor sp. ZSWI3]